MSWFLDNESVENWAWVTGFSPEQCQDIIKTVNSNYDLQDGMVGSHSEGNESVEEDIRKSKLAFLKMEDVATHWIYASCVDSIKYANDNWFKYDLTHIETLQFTTYTEESNGYYGAHIDTKNASFKGSVRKLSFSILLSDPSDFEGGDLILHNSKYPESLPKKQGQINFFPSWTLHEVTPVTKGTRISLVGWVNGPRFR
jgi:PKHD-type hydroxylase